MKFNKIMKMMDEINHSHVNKPISQEEAEAELIIKANEQKITLDKNEANHYLCAYFSDAFCNHCPDSTCPDCDEKYYGGIANEECCNGYHYQ